MSNTKPLLFTFFTFIILSTAAFPQSIPFYTGRIAISSDGNEHDEDDWAATPMTLALLASNGLQDKVTVYIFSDHIWGSDKEKPGAAEQMRESAFIGAKTFGFKKTKFIEAVTAQNFAIIELANQINESSAKDPLTIIAAGPMEIIGTSLNEADSLKLKYVRLISHSTWNDEHADKPYDWENHSGWTWEKIKDKFEKHGLQFDHIADQNGGEDYEGLKANVKKYDWLKTSQTKNKKPFAKGSWDWLYSRLEAAQKGDEFDPSDSGMIIYLLTGKEKTDPEDVRQMMENPKKYK